jgi:hypothetical protein
MKFTPNWILSSVTGEAIGRQNSTSRKYRKNQENLKLNIFFIFLSRLKASAIYFHRWFGANGVQKSLCAPFYPGINSCTLSENSSRNFTKSAKIHFQIFLNILPNPPDQQIQEYLKQWLDNIGNPTYIRNIVSFHSISFSWEGVGRTKKRGPTFPLLPHSSHSPSSPRSCAKKV